MSHLSVSSGSPGLTRGSGLSKRPRPSSPQGDASLSNNVLAFHEQSPAHFHPVYGPVRSLASSSHSQLPLGGMSVLAPTLYPMIDLEEFVEDDAQNGPSSSPSPRPGAMTPPAVFSPVEQSRGVSTSEAATSSSREVASNAFFLAAPNGHSSSSSSRTVPTIPPAVFSPVEQNSGVSTSEEAAPFSREDASAALLGLQQGLLDSPEKNGVNILSVQMHGGKGHASKTNDDVLSTKKIIELYIPKNTTVLYLERPSDNTTLTIPFECDSNYRKYILSHHHYDLLQIRQAENIAGFKELKRRSSEQFRFGCLCDDGEKYESKCFKFVTKITINPA